MEREEGFNAEDIAFVSDNEWRPPRAGALAHFEAPYIDESIAFWNNSVLAYCVDYRDFRVVDQLQIFVNDHWVSRGQISVRRMDDLFVFHCENAQDVEDLLARSCAAIAGALFVFARWTPGLIPRTVRFPRVCMWVRVCGLPFEFLNMHAANTIGNILGGQFEVDAFEGIPNHDYLRIRVCLALEEPLMPGFFIACEDSKIMWVQFRYEELFKYCVRCGRISHKVTRCTLSRTRIVESIQAMLGGVCERGFMVAQSQNMYTMFNLDLRALPNTSRHVTSRVRLGLHPGVRPRADYFVDRIVDIDIGTTGGGRIYPGMAFNLYEQPFASPILFPSYHNFNAMHARVNEQQQVGNMEVDGPGNEGMQEAELGIGGIGLDVQEGRVQDLGGNVGMNDFVGEGVNNINIPEIPPPIDQDPYIAFLQQEGEVSFDNHDRNFQNNVDRRLRLDEFGALSEEEQRGYYQVFNLVEVLPVEELGGAEDMAGFRDPIVADGQGDPVQDAEEGEEWPQWDPIPVDPQGGNFQMGEGVEGPILDDDLADFYSQGSAQDWPPLSPSSSSSAAGGYERGSEDTVLLYDQDGSGFHTPVLNLEGLEGEGGSAGDLNLPVVAEEGAGTAAMNNGGVGGMVLRGEGETWRLLSAHALKEYVPCSDTISDSGLANVSVNVKDKWRRICGMERFKRMKSVGGFNGLGTKVCGKRKTISEPCLVYEVDGAEMGEEVSSKGKSLMVHKRQCGERAHMGHVGSSFVVEFEDSSRLVREQMMEMGEFSGAVNGVESNVGQVVGFAGIEPNQFSSRG